MALHQGLTAERIHACSWPFSVLPFPKDKEKCEESS